MRLFLQPATSMSPNRTVSFALTPTSLHFPCDIDDRGSTGRLALRSFAKTENGELDRSQMVPVA